MDGRQLEKRFWFRGYSLPPRSASELSRYGHKWPKLLHRPHEMIEVCADYAVPVHFKSAYAQCQTSFETQEAYKVMIVLIS